MFLCDQWRDYEVLDTGDGEKLERWGGIVLRRPDPQVIWPKADPALWDAAQATYMRSDTGGGHWEFREKLPDRWVIGLNNLKFYVKPTGFKHTGLFPEQAANWAFMQERIRAAGAWGRPPRVLNLFAYTGGATLACAAAGARVCHVDASKGMVAWARENAAESGMDGRPIRWIVDDCAKFVAREQRRGTRYDAIIMDPPSYGRGPGGEVWKLEDAIDGFIEACAGVLSEKPLFVAVNSYTTGLAPSVMEYMLRERVARRFGGRTECDEIGLPVTATGGVVPCGATAWWLAL